jgi:hypothetical protein
MQEINIKLIKDDGKGIERNSFVSIEDYFVEPSLWFFESDEYFYCENGGNECITQCEHCKNDENL